MWCPTGLDSNNTLGKYVSILKRIASTPVSHNFELSGAAFRGQRVQALGAYPQVRHPRSTCSAKSICE